MTLRHVIGVANGNATARLGIGGGGSTGEIHVFEGPEARSVNNGAVSAQGLRWRVPFTSMYGRTPSTSAIEAKLVADGFTIL